MKAFTRNKTACGYGDTAKNKAFCCSVEFVRDRRCGRCQPRVGTIKQIQTLNSSSSMPERGVTYRGYKALTKELYMSTIEWQANIPTLVADFSDSCGVCALCKKAPNWSGSRTGAALRPPFPGSPPPTTFTFWNLFHHQTPKA